MKTFFKQIKVAYKHWTFWYRVAEVVFWLLLLPAVYMVIVMLIALDNLTNVKITFVLTAILSATAASAFRYRNYRVEHRSETEDTDTGLVIFYFLCSVGSGTCSLITMIFYTVTMFVPM